MTGSTLRIVLGTVAIALAAATLALGASDPWQDAQKGLSFQLFQPRTTLGLKLGRHQLARCWEGNAHWSAAYGASSNAPQFFVDEYAPRRACANAGEWVEHGTRVIGGVKAQLGVNCGGTRRYPNCPLADGTKYGYVLTWDRPPAAGTAFTRSTTIFMTSARMPLSRFLSAARSLGPVATRTQPATSPANAGAAAACSKATARQVAKSFFVWGSNVRDPVGQVLCGAFAGAGSSVMAVAFTAPTCWPRQGWAVYRLTDGAWRLAMVQNGAFIFPLRAAGGDIRETQPVFRRGDARCTPSGGSHSRLWHWNGSAFVAGPWTQATGGAPTSGAGASKQGYFKTPSRNIVCGYAYGPKYPKAYVGCRMRSPLKPDPQRRGPRCWTVPDLFLPAAGRASLGKAICPGEPEGDAGAAAFEAQAGVLAYGKTWSGGGMSCKSAFTGLTCRNKGGHGFFLSRERWRVF